MPKTRVQTYAVTHTLAPDEPPRLRLIEAASRRQAIQYAAASTIDARLATFEDGHRAAQHGIEIESALEQPPETTTTAGAAGTDPDDLE